MGGQPGGEIAARTITATLLEYFRDPVREGADDVTALLVEAHRRVRERQATEPAIVDGDEEARDSGYDRVRSPSTPVITAPPRRRERRLPRLAAVLAVDGFAAPLARAA